MTKAKAENIRLDSKRFFMTIFVVLWYLKPFLQ
jgi:hypothetical protein